MTTSLLTNDPHTLICKHLPELPPVVSDWQQSCKQPRCSHYFDGECCHPGRQSASAPCPFDGMELPLEDAKAVNAADATSDDNDFQRWWSPDVPKKG